MRMRIWSESESESVTRDMMRKGRKSLCVSVSEKRQESTLTVPILFDQCVLAVLPWPSCARATCACQARTSGTEYPLQRRKKRKKKQKERKKGMRFDEMRENEEEHEGKIRKEVMRTGKE